MKPRRYQERAIENFQTWVHRPNDLLATIILPTGTGKTRTASWALEELFKEQKRKTLWCAHREELIEQAAGVLGQIPGISLNIEMAERRADPDVDIVVGTVQTLHRSRKNLKGFVPEIVIVDEWHHYDVKNKQYHGLMEKFPEAHFLGLTATPFRFMGGDLPLGTKLIEMDIGLAVAHDYLVPPKPEALRSDVSLAAVKSRAGDFALNELSEAVNVEHRNRLIAERILVAVKDEKRQGILFGVDVAHAQTMAALLEKEVRVGQVYGETPKEERRELMKRVRNGEIDVLCNNLVCTEGFDVPHMSFIGIARPTKSLGLFCQMMGRGLRLSEGKRDCLVIDVHDTVKVSQKRVTYVQVASAGDIDGSQRRAEAVISEPIADKLDNFPVVMRLQKGDRWVVDNKRWFAPAWMIADNQWVLTWSKTHEAEPSSEKDWVPIEKMPSQPAVRNRPMVVRHQKFGEGVAHDVAYGLAESFLIVNFEQHGDKHVPISVLEQQKIKFDKKKLAQPIQRAFYICMSADGTGGRVISLKLVGRQFHVVGEARGDQTTINEMIRASAAEDDMENVVKASAKWRNRSATKGQLGIIKSAMDWGKLPPDIDLKTLSSGDASTLIDQINWKDRLDLFFGAKDRKQLIGYASSDDDV